MAHPADAFDGPDLRSVAEDILNTIEQIQAVGQYPYENWGTPREDMINNIISRLQKVAAYKRVRSTSINPTTKDGSKS